MWIDEAGRDHKAPGINRPGCYELSFVGVADEYDAAAANANVGRARFSSRAVDKLAVQDEQIEFLSWNHLSERVAYA